MNVKMIPAPSKLVAAFDQQNVKHEQKRIQCPVVALAETEFGQMRAMCAIPQSEYFVPVEEAPQQLHGLYGGIFHFSGYYYIDSEAEQMTPVAVAV